MQVLIKKGENSSKKEKKKSNCSSLCRDRVLYVAENIQADSKGALSRQKTACHDRKWEESNNSVETKKVYVVTRFFSRMSTPGKICRDKEAPVATNETGRRQKLCCDKGSSVTTLIITTWKNLLRQKKSLRERPLLRQGNVCCDTEQRNICCDKKMYVVTLKEEETLVATDK